MEDAGADSICIKDMAGLLTPYNTYELVKEIKSAVKVPIQVHTHYTSWSGFYGFDESSRGRCRYY